MISPCHDATSRIALCLQNQKAADICAYGCRSNSSFFCKVNSFLRKWCCVDSLSVVSDPDARKIPLPTGKNRSFCGAEREMDWIVALRGSADIIRGQVSAALTAAANVNTGDSQHEFPCGQLAVGEHGCFCSRQPLCQLQPCLLLRIAQKPVAADLQHTGC